MPTYQRIPIPNTSYPNPTGGFVSRSGLVAWEGPGANGVKQIFVYNPTSGITSALTNRTVAEGGTWLTQDPRLSSYIVYQSYLDDPNPPLQIWPGYYCYIYDGKARPTPIVLRYKDTTADHGGGYSTQNAQVNFWDQVCYTVNATKSSVWLSPRADSYVEDCIQVVFGDINTEGREECLVEGFNDNGDILWKKLPTSDPSTWTLNLWRNGNNVQLSTPAGVSQTQC